MSQGYRDFAQFLSEHFSCKMQKLAVNAGFTCPNRDGSKGRGGCTYCNNQTFNPEYCAPSIDVKAQLEQGKSFFGRKYSEMRYLAYFQAYTNTHGEIDRLLQLYEDALSVDKVDGIIIGTRPDCMPDELLQRLVELNKRHWVMIEYGAETSHDSTLNFINRCHSWQDTIDAVIKTKQAGIATGIHLILGLPGEDEKMILQTIERASQLPLDTIKLHQLQLIKGTRMAQDVANGIYSVPQFTVESYINLCCKVIEHTSPSIAIERFVSQSPDSLLISPRWGLKNYQFTNLLNSRIKALNIQQGSRLLNINL